MLITTVRVACLLLNLHIFTLKITNCGRTQAPRLSRVNGSRACAVGLFVRCCVTEYCRVRLNEFGQSPCKDVDSMITRSITRLDYRALHRTGANSPRMDDDAEVQLSTGDAVHVAGNAHSETGAIGGSEPEEKSIDELMAESRCEREKLEKELRYQEKLLTLKQLEAENAALRERLRAATAQTQSYGKSRDSRHVTPPPPVRQRPDRGQQKTERSKVKAAGKPKHTTTITDLRGDLGLQAGAHDTLQRLGLVEDSTNGAESSAYSSVESDDPAGSRIKQTSEFDSNLRSKMSRNARRRKRNKPKSSRPKSFMYEQSDSETSDSSNSFTRNSKCRFKWPNEHLGARYNNFGKSEMKFKQLDMRTLMAGELNIVSNPKVCDNERKARLQLLGDAVFSSGFYQWPAVLKWYAAVLSEVECGNMEWGDDYSRLEQQMLMPFPIHKSGKNEKRVDKVREESRPNNSEERTLFCADYQQKNCAHSDHHNGQLFGRSAWLQHICSACWKQNKAKLSHPASSTNCPHYEH